MTSQNVTLSAKDKRDIETVIKPMLLEGKSQLDMSLALKLRRETVNRKISRWTKTRDFEDFIKEAWLEKYQKVDDTTAFNALTKMYCKLIGNRTEITEDINQIELVYHVTKTDEQIRASRGTTTVP
jgi:hypothetical protein